MYIRANYTYVNTFLLFISEQEAKFVQDRITGVEKHFAELCMIFAAFTRKAARCFSVKLYRLFFFDDMHKTFPYCFTSGLVHYSPVFFRLRDKSDELAKIIQTYADSEIINRSLSAGLTNFSATLSVIGDYR